MKDWNVVVTVQENGFKQAMDVLRDYGPVSKTDYFNVLVMRVDDPVKFLEDLQHHLVSLPVAQARLARVMPVTEKFHFQSPLEFEARTKEKVENWLPQLDGMAFHVRMHRRGFKDRLSSQNEELFLDHHIINRLRERNQDAYIDFNDPDFIIALETVGQDGGLSLWNRDQRHHFPLLKLD